MTGGMMMGRGSGGMMDMGETMRSGKM